MNFKTLFPAAAMAVAVACSAPAAFAATTGLGEYILAEGGNVTAYFRGQSASYTSELYLDQGGTAVFLFNNHETAVGTSVDLGHFAAGTELKFFLKVLSTGNTFHTGDGSRNTDGLAHAVVLDNWKPGETYVGFEDILGGGDRDYNDLEFSFTNVAAAPELPAVPLPAAGLMLLSGIGALALRRRR